MEFDINSWPLAKNHTGKKVDLSFADYHCFVIIKANRVW